MMMLKMMMIFALLQLSLSFLIEDNIPWPYTICGHSSWTIRSVSLNGSPSRSATSTLKMDGIISNRMSFQKVHCDYFYDRKFVHDEYKDYNESFDEEDTIEFTYEFEIPSFAQAGLYELKFQFITLDGQVNGCFHLQYTL